MIAFSSQCTSCAPTAAHAPRSQSRKRCCGDDLGSSRSTRKTFDAPVSRQQIHDVIDQQPSDNLFCALRIDGNFRHAHTWVPYRVRRRHTAR